MHAEIITIGDEILIGQILDSNSKWIATELNKIGVSVYQITSIQDDKSHILKALEEAQKNVDIVIITGGLGPTKDDITKLTLAEYFNDELILDEDVIEHIKKMFARSNYPFTELNKNQALLPSKCLKLVNPVGTASGMWFFENKKVVVSLPGVPFEMKALMEQSVLPKIQQTFKLPYIVHKTILTYGIGESMLAERIVEWENNLPSFIKLAYLPAFGNVRLRLTAKGINENELKHSVEDQVIKLTGIIQDVIIGFDEDETIEVIIGKLLKGKNKTLSIAESCTGGSIAKRITGIPGASKYFNGAIIAYNKAIKMDELGVSKELIDKYSVVSSQVAEAMALGIKEKYKSSYAISTTGNAGPSTDDTTSLLGVVFIAIATPSGVFSEEFSFGQPREKVIERTTNKALELLRKEILKNN